MDSALDGAKLGFLAADVSVAAAMTLMCRFLKEAWDCLLSIF